MSDLPLSFTEQGMIPNFVNGGMPNRLLPGAVDAPTIIDVLPAMRFSDVSLFAAFLAHRTRRDVGFDFNDVLVVVPAVDDLSEPPMLDEAAIIKRFDNITGAGELTDAQKLAIGTASAKAYISYSEQLANRPKHS